MRGWTYFVKYIANRSRKEYVCEIESYNVLEFKSIWEIARDNQDSQAEVANMEPTWVLSAPGGPHVSPINFAIREYKVKKALLVCTNICI